MENRSDTIIIGAGLTGLSCGYHLGRGYTILEKTARAGGLCGSVSKDGFTFDQSGHFLHLHNPATKRLIQKLLGNKLIEVKRSAWIYTLGTFLPFPFQANLRFLPQEIRTECLEKFLHKPKPSNTDNFLAWSLDTFGEGITKYFMKPYNEKLWTVPMNKLTTEWVAPFVPKPSVNEIVRGATTGQDKDFGYNVNFYYPKTGGCQTLVEAFSSKVQNIVYNEKATRVDLRTKTVDADSGRKYKFVNLVSTQPLVELLERTEGLPSEIRKQSKKLLWNSVLCLNLAIKKTLLSKALQSKKHWVYLPGQKFSAYRFGIYTNVLESMAPKGYSSMYIEISYPCGASLNFDETLNRVLDEMRSEGFMDQKAKPDVVNFSNIPCAYVIYDKHRSEAVKTILGFLEENGIHSIGRYGGWEYSFMESSILQGMKTAEKIRATIDHRQ